MIDNQLFFPPFSLDESNHCLKRGNETIRLRPKTLAVLSYLAKHPQRLVSKEELLATVWAGAKVVDAALRVSVQEIRRALGDESNRPRYIETVGKKGWRFIASVSLKLSESGGQSFHPFVGRTAELDRLRDHLEFAGSGKRQIVFISGEPGIGKTTLIDAFLKTVLLAIGVITALGFCIEQFGSGEAYLPVFDLLERMCNSPGSDAVLDCLRQYAPSWLVGLPMLAGPTERTELARQTVGATPERRMREIAGFLEAISKTQTVVLVFEDLHWADPSTLTLLSFLARRREAARLLIIATYREDEVKRSRHPLNDIKAELQAHQQCAHLPLKLLAQSAVGEYLAVRLETEAVPKPLLSTVYDRSDGNPLFMVNITDYLIAREAIARDNGVVRFLITGQKDSVPETIRGLIERQVAALSPQDQELLEVGAVAGTTFSVAPIARILEQSRDAIENRYRDLAQQTHFLRETDMRVRPNGRGTPRYSFVHALYQNVIYDRIDEAKRRRLHQLIGDRTEAAYSNSTQTVAAELAAHFERSGDTERATRYLLQAAQRSFSVCAYPETIEYATRALELVKPPRGSKHPSVEIEIGAQLLTAVATCASKGYAASETRDAFARAQLLSRNSSNYTLAFESLAGTWSYNLLRGNFPASLELARELLALAHRTQNWTYQLNAQLAMGCSLFYLGNIVTAHEHLQKLGAQYNFEQFQATSPTYGWDPGIAGTCYDAMSLWLLGYPQKADQEVQKALDFARRLSLPFHSAFANGLLSVYYMYRGDIDNAFSAAETVLALSAENGFYHWLAAGKILKGWGLIKRKNYKEGISTLTGGVANWESTGARMLVPTYRALLAESFIAAGDRRKALSFSTESIALSQQTRESYYDAELHRLRGEIILGTRQSLSDPTVRAAEAELLHAVAIAKRQKTKSLELRATVSLGHLWQKTGKRKESKRMLSKIYGWFTEGLDTPDLKRAKALLDELDHS